MPVSHEDSSFTVVYLTLLYCPLYKVFTVLIMHDAIAFHAKVDVCEHQCFFKQSAHANTSRNSFVDVGKSFSPLHCSIIPWCCKALWIYASVCSVISEAFHLKFVSSAILFKIWDANVSWYLYFCCLTFVLWKSNRSWGLRIHLTSKNCRICSIVGKKS